MSTPSSVDVLVVGAGNAALCSALAARQGGASVLAIEKAPEHLRGGNTYFTGGAIRFAFNGFDDIRTLIPDLSEQEAAVMEVGSYPETEFYDDLMRAEIPDNLDARLQHTRSLRGKARTGPWCRGRLRGWSSSRTPAQCCSAQPDSEQQQRGTAQSKPKAAGGAKTPPQHQRRAA